jgi:hypothetical protein
MYACMHVCMYVSHSRWTNKNTYELELEPYIYMHIRTHIHACIHAHTLKIASV